MCPVTAIKKQCKLKSGVGKVTGDIAWGGNWFFLVEDSPLPWTPKKSKN
jgi:4-hydroxyproline epimerase